MKNFFFFLLVSFSAFSAEAGKVIFSDTYIFKIMGEVVSVRDLESDAKKLTILSCHYPNSLVISSFKDYFGKIKNVDFEKLVAKKPPYSDEEIKLFEQAVHYSKLKFYIQTQEVILGENFAKALFLRGRVNHCSERIFTESKELAKEFESIFKIEAFIRSRFLPELKGEPDEAQIKAAKSNIELFLDSVQKQVEDEIFWK